MAEDIYREVDEELKAERMRMLARRYAGVAVAVVVVVVAGAGLWSWQLARHKALDQVATGAYLAALRQTDHLPDQVGSSPVALAGKAQSGLDALQKLATSGDQGVATLARMQEAAVQAARGDAAAALAAWGAVQDNPDADPALRSIATLLWCQHQLDTGDIPTLRSRLSLLTGQGKAWNGLAVEALAVLDVREGHKDDARKKLSALVDSAETPAGVRNRAQDMMQALDPSAG
ncbi:tetratricopeptide repeat protein [Acetobacter lambici]|uniref:Tetratricopeptide repeat protein n=1 Tax=Acetobacter lambici TaxID=1332824 RepID=A0ABT1EX49_9PROT|nr:tetratricopeptide repeat protein [Acetobacter lambici]MCP1257515.1 tetratricopeptide repeat protein [Acetobacter lambici]NHO55896.1 tetratricopeptide repeat protein [Acetobacter lambici]